MSAAAGWYPDPGGGDGLYRYWDGRVWSASTSTHPSGPPPAQGLVNAGSAAGSTPEVAHTHYGSTQNPSSSNPYGQSSYPDNAYAQYQQVRRKRSGVGWWIAGAALVVVIVIVAVIAVRAITGGGVTAGGGLPGGQDTSEVCPRPRLPTAAPPAEPADGRVHGGPVSYPRLGPPWGAPRPDDRVPFGVNALAQEITVQANYAPSESWVASVLVGELQAGDGFFTPQQGSQIVVRCIIGAFYGNNPVTSDVKKDQAATIDGHDAWIVESHLSFDIPGLQTKGELLIVAIVAANEAGSGLYYASIPDTSPELVQPARDALKQLKVDG